MKPHYTFITICPSVLLSLLLICEGNRFFFIIYQKFLLSKSLVNFSKVVVQFSYITRDLISIRSVATHCWYIIIFLSSSSSTISFTILPSYFLFLLSLTFYSLLFFPHPSSSLILPIPSSSSLLLRLFPSHVRFIPLPLLSSATPYYLSASLFLPHSPLLLLLT